jgi:hypothetical protein
MMAFKKEREFLTSQSKVASSVEQGGDIYDIMESDKSDDDDGIRSGS